MISKYDEVYIIMISAQPGRNNGVSLYYVHVSQPYNFVTGTQDSKQVSKTLTKLVGILTSYIIVT